MKRFVIVAVALALAGCDEPSSAETQIDSASYTVRTVKVKGHEYIIFDGYKCGNIIHSESCPCKE